MKNNKKLEKKYYFCKKIEMPTINKNNYISIAKAIGIILMVIVHSGCPALMSNFIYKKLYKYLYN